MILATPHLKTEAAWITALCLIAVGAIALYGAMEDRLTAAERNIVSGLEHAARERIALKQRIQALEQDNADTQGLLESAEREAAELREVLERAMRTVDGRAM